MMAHRNWYFERTEDGHMTPHGLPNFNAYVENLCVLVFQTDRWTDGQTDGGINPGGAGLPIGSSR
jgi:hypothetical protein